MLRFDTVDPTRHDVIALGQLPRAASSELWMLEARHGLALRAASGCGISYNQDGTLYDADGETFSNLKSLRVVATNRTSVSGVPLFYVHHLRASGEAKLYAGGGELSSEQWMVEDGALYVTEPGPWRLEVDGAIELLDLRPVIAAWPSDTDAPGRMMRVSVSDAGGKRTIVASLDSEVSSPALELSCDISPAWVKVTESEIELYTEGSAAPTTIVRFTDASLDALVAAIAAAPNWRVARLGSPGSRVRGSASAAAFILPAGLTAVPEGGTVTLSSRAIWWRSEPTVPFGVSIAVSERNPWPLRISAGHLLTEETLDADSRAALATLLGCSVAATATAEWTVQEHSLYAVSSGTTLQWDNVPAWYGEAQEVDEELVPDGPGGRRWLASRRMIDGVSELRIQGRVYTDAIESIDPARGIIVTRFAATSVAARYRYFSDAVELSSFTHPLTGQSVPVEFNPRFDANRYQSRLIVLTPARLTLALNKAGQTVQYVLVNYSPLRVVATAAPYEELRTLGSHWSTLLSVGSLRIKLPYQVLALAHYTPRVDPADLATSTRRGGWLREDLSDEELARLSPETLGWEELTARKAYQLNQTLVIHLPIRIRDKYGDDETRRRCARMLPAATFFSIQWY